MKDLYFAVNSFLLISVAVNAIALLHIVPKYNIKPTIYYLSIWLTAVGSMSLLGYLVDHPEQPNLYYLLARAAFAFQAFSVTLSYASQLPESKYKKFIKRFYIFWSIPAIVLLINLIHHKITGLK